MVDGEELVVVVVVVAMIVSAHLEAEGGRSWAARPRGQGH